MKILQLLNKSYNNFIKMIICNICNFNIAPKKSIIVQNFKKVFETWEGGGGVKQFQGLQNQKVLNNKKMP